MKLNVILITYKQENYIRQALESILMQKTTFDFNIIVADDSSPDNTLAIIKEYADKETSRDFIFLEPAPNMGHMKNYQRAFAACNGQYVAIMEGDDYWHDEHLQHHAQFLDSHSECSMSFNRHIRLFESSNGSREEILDWDLDTEYELMTTEDIIFVNKIGNLSCCVFCNKHIQQLDPDIFENNFADWLLGMIMGQNGPLARQKTVTSTYRIHDNGQWTQMSDKERDRSILEVIDYYDQFLNYKYTEQFTQLKKWKTINVYGDKSLKGRIKSMTPSFIRKLYRKITG